MRSRWLWLAGIASSTQPACGAEVIVVGGAVAQGGQAGSGQSYPTTAGLDWVSILESGPIITEPRLALTDGGVVVAGGYDERLGDLAAPGSTFQGFVAMLSRDDGTPKRWRFATDPGVCDSSLSTFFGLQSSPTGQLVASGVFLGAVGLGAQTYVAPACAFALYQGLVAAFTPELDVTYSMTLGSIGSSSIDVWPTAFPTADGGVVLAGFFLGAIVTPPVALQSQGLDGFVMRLDATGTPLWGRRYGDEGDDTFHAVRALPDGSVWVEGSYDDGSTSLGGTTIAGGDSTGKGCYLAAVDSVGEPRHSRVLPCAALSSTAFADDGSSVSAAEFDAQVDFGGGTLVANGGWALGLASFDPSGEHRWSRVIATSGAVAPASTVALTPSGMIVVVVDYVGSLVLDALSLPQDGGRHAVLLGFTPEGELSWHHPIRSLDHLPGSLNGSYVSAVRAEDEGVYLSALVDGPVDFGAGPVCSPGVGACSEETAAIAVAKYALR